MRKISTSIPTQRKLKDHVEQNFNHFARGKSHTSPEHEKDVTALQGKYRDAKAHIYKRGRHLPAEQKVEDVIADGHSDSLAAAMTRWAADRVTQKSTAANFDSVETIIQRLQQATHEDPMDVDDDSENLVGEAQDGSDGYWGETLSDVFGVA